MVETEGRQFEMGSWLSQNIQIYNRYEIILQELDSRRDSMPQGFNPREFLQFLRGTVNEVKRVSALNQALTDALRFVNKGKEVEIKDLKVSDTDGIPV
jgi:hypothetical protein